MTAVVQAPLNITVTNRVVRIQPYTPPFQIINTNLNATIWAANNPSIQPGVGTSINPGTSLEWSSPGEVFLILGNDTLSVTEGSAAVIISYDVNSWQPSPAAIAAAVINSGVLVIDKPVQLFNNGNTSDTGALDISRYNSILLELGSNGATTFTISWENGASNVFQEYLYCYSPTFAIWRGALPCKGAQVQVTSNAPSSVKLVASYRTVPAIQNQIPISFNNLLANFSGSMPTGTGTANLYSLPYFGEVFVTATQTVVGTNSYLVISQDGSATFTLYPMTTTSIASGECDITVRVPCWGKQLAFRLFNSNAATSNYQLQVSPAQPR